MLSILGALIAQVLTARLHELVPEINTESLETLLHTISSSMLVLAFRRNDFAFSAQPVTQPPSLF
jgi:hypothetical protein